MANKSFGDDAYWSDAWARHIEDYLAAPPRCGIWLEYYFPDKTLSFLECAGGSCRDSRYLFGENREAIGSDFDEKTLNYVRKKFKGSNFILRKENAFSLNFDDASRDLVFHNGFWVCFDDDGKIDELIKEQARVAKKYLVALVHNKNNQSLVENFKKLSRKDDLYKIRFFDLPELDRVFKSAGVKYKKIIYEKFGGPVDRLFAIERKIPFLKPLVRWVVPRLYRFQPWSEVERVAMIVELER